eukprot:Pompholyxophrys_punicea_v1_NODE_796_length_1281_cov_5.646003.p2 type:complete len:101 gc:universal NODE_796_length_1281_cov_5.646003:535-837(+)
MKAHAHLCLGIPPILLSYKNFLLFSDLLVCKAVSSRGKNWPDFVRVANLPARLEYLYLHCRFLAVCQWENHVACYSAQILIYERDPFLTDSLNFVTNSSL